MTKPASPASTRRPRVPFWVIPPLVLFGLLLFGATTAIASYTCDGPAMEPTLLNGDRMFVLRHVFAGDPEPGQIVVARGRDGFEIVKRVVAVGGQVVQIAQSEVIVDGRAIGGFVDCPSHVLDGDDALCAGERLGEREWITVQSASSPPQTMDPVTVPAGHVFVLGDHRDRSNDSRAFGTVPLENVIGVVLWR